MPSNRDEPRKKGHAYLDPDHGAGTGTRGDIDGFSRRARKRMLLLVNTLDLKSALPVFVTLTYPDVWNGDWQRWKRDLDTFGKWMSKTYPDYSAIWKLEPQKRGAPHFHVMIWGVGFLPWQMLAVRWAEITASEPCKCGRRCACGSRVELPRDFPTGPGSGRLFTTWVQSLVNAGRIGEDLGNHVLAGTEARRVHSRNGVKAYASKRYMGKQFEGFRGVGRFWGVHNRERLPRTPPVRVSVPDGPLIQFARIARKYVMRKTNRKSGSWKMRTASVDIMTERPGEWARLLSYLSVREGGGFQTRTGDLDHAQPQRTYATVSRGHRTNGQRDAFHLETFGKKPEKKFGDGTDFEWN